MHYLIPKKIETSRLILRTFKENDWRDLHEYYSDEKCVQYTLGQALSEEMTWATLAKLAGHWQLRGYGPYAVEEKKSRKVIGIVGPWYPMGWPEPEIKWALSRRYWGQGKASEATRAVKKMAAQYLPEIKLISLIRKENKASIRLAKAIGATFEKEINFRGNQWLVFRHFKTSSLSLAADNDEG